MSESQTICGIMSLALYFSQNLLHCHLYPTKEAFSASPVRLSQLKVILLPTLEFEKAAQFYKEALTKNNYEYKLEFDPSAGNPRKNSNNRKRKINGSTHLSAKM